MTLEHIAHAWRLKLPPAQKFVLVTIACHMGDHFDLLQMSELVSEKTGYPPDVTEVLIDQLIGDEIIVPVEYEYDWTIALDGGVI